MEQNIQFTISGQSPYGMRIKGGVEFDMPIFIESITPNGKADTVGLRVGDVLESINGESVTSSTHENAKNLILRAPGSLIVCVKRGSDISPFIKSSTSLPSQHSITPSSQYKSESLAGNTSSTPSSSTHKTESTFKPTSKPVSEPAPPTKPTVISTGGGVGNVVGSRDNVKFTPYQPDQHVDPPAVSSSTTTQQVGPVIQGKTCQGCKMPIGTGSFINIEGRHWHSNHFNCDKCLKNLASIGFFEQENKIFCKECYGDQFSAKCAICTKPCVDNYVTTGQQAYHSECFTCKKCGIRLGGKPFNQHEGFPHCMSCLTDMMSTKCHKCTKAIVPGENFVEVREKPYHSSCFVCSICGANLASKGTFNMKDDQPACKEHI